MFPSSAFLRPASPHQEFGALSSNASTKVKTAISKVTLCARLYTGTEISATSSNPICLSARLVLHWNLCSDAFTFDFHSYFNTLQWISMTKSFSPFKSLEAFFFVHFLSWLSNKGMPQASKLFLKRGIGSVSLEWHHWDKAEREGASCTVLPINAVKCAEMQMSICHARTFIIRFHFSGTVCTCG